MAVTLSSTSDEVNWPVSTPPFGGLDNVTWAFTVDIASLTSSGRYLAHWVAADTFLTQDLNTDALGWVIENAGGDRRGWYTPNSSMSTGLHRVAGRWEYASGSHNASIYINGVEQSLSTWFPNWTTQSSTIVSSTNGDISVGQDGASNNAVTGDYSHVAIWDAYLSDAEMAAITKEDSPLLHKPGSLVFYADLNTDTSIDDIIGGREGTSDSSTSAESPLLTEPAAAIYVSSVAAAGGSTHPVGPFGHPLHGAFAGPVGA